KKLKAVMLHRKLQPQSPIQPQRSLLKDLKIRLKRGKGASLLRRT
ncbi:hypothetical protein Csa_023849, partial [Cucumis sativus]